ncbi:MAG: LamG-like jellyroll fold domain-containing protein [Candidatus Paceibacterota bacterium]
MNKSIKKQFAFTLIELLVVIAIIGILSALIVVGMNSATDKARLAKGQAFSSSLRNALMDNLISDWKFDQVGAPGANQTPDTWGANTCTLYGAGGSQNLPQLQTTGCVLGNCLTFDGTDDYVNCGNNVAIGYNSFTFSFWAKTSVSNAIQSVIRRAASTTGWVGTFYFPYSSTRNALFYITESSYSAGSIYMYMEPYNNSSNVTDNIWHYFVGTCDRSKAAPPQVYLDGILKNSSTYYGNCNQVTDNIPTGALLIGASNYFNGSIDEVRIYSVAIPTSQIKQNYLTGLNRLLVNNQVSGEEYAQRVAELETDFAKNQ